MAQRASLARGGKPIQQDPTQCPSGMDTTTFFFPNIPLEIKSTIPLFHSSPGDLSVALLKAVMAYQQEVPSRFRLDPALYTSHPAVSMETINQILTALYYITRIAIRNKVKISVIRSDLLKMNVPKALVEATCSEITAHRMEIESHIMTHRIQFHKLEKVRWRMDVVISSGSLSRVMRPNIMMQMIMKNGKIVTFEISLEQFNQLRYSVAKVLHEMQSLERHPIIRIVNEFKRKDEEEYNR